MSACDDNLTCFDQSLKLPRQLSLSEFYRLVVGDYRSEADVEVKELLASIY